MESLQKKGSSLITKKYGKIINADGLKTLHKIAQARTNHLCVKHYINEIEQPKTYELYYLQELEGLAYSTSKNKGFLKKSFDFLSSSLPWELDPSSWHEPLERKKNKELIENSKTQHSVESDDKCPNCKVGNIECFDLKQMRGADEPMTQLWRCKACNFRWNI